MVLLHLKLTVYQLHESSFVFLLLSVECQGTLSLDEQCNVFVEEHLEGLCQKLCQIQDLQVHCCVFLGLSYVIRKGLLGSKA